jgi:hypothetical protein
MPRAQRVPRDRPADAGGVVDGVLHRRDLFRVFVGDLDAELIFQGHHQLHRVQGVSTQISHEGLFVGDLRLFNAELFGNDFLTRASISLMVSLWGL